MAINPYSYNTYQDYTKAFGQQNPNPYGEGDSVQSMYGGAKPISGDAWNQGYVNQYQDPNAHTGFLTGAKSNYLGELARSADQAAGNQTAWGGPGAFGDYLASDRAYGVSQWGDYKDPSTVGSSYARPLYENYVNSLGGKDFADLSYGELSQLGKYYSGDRHSLTGGKVGAVRDFVGEVAMPVAVGGLLAYGGGAALSGAMGGTGAAGAAAGGTTSSASAFPGLSVMGGGAGTGLGGTALTGTVGTGITAPTIGAGLSVGGSAIPTLGAAGLGAAGTAAGSSGMAGLGLTDYLSLAGGLTDMYGQYQAGEAMQDANAAAAARAREGAAYATGAYNPYMQAGLQGLTGLGQMGSYDPTTDPQYQNQLAEMSRLMDMRSAATGMGRSSADLKQRAALGSDLYGQAYNREYNRFGDLTGLGQFGTTGAANAQLGQAQTLGNLALQGGQVQGNQLTGLYGGLGQAFQLPAMTQQQNLQNQMYSDYIAAMNRGY